MPRSPRTLPSYFPSSAFTYSALCTDLVVLWDRFLRSTASLDTKVILMDSNLGYVFAPVRWEGMGQGE